ncbi:MAG: hypothetical protein RAP70_08300 [Candidatus Celaenobacter antarcticus]|nr:hypothetical protein [Candidatus Celaenobacter antarcticus]
MKKKDDNYSFNDQIRKIHSLLSRNGLDWEDIKTLFSIYWGKKNKEKLVDTLEAGRHIIVEKKIPENKNAFKKFCLCLNDIFDANIDISVFSNNWIRIKKLIWEIVLAIMSLFVVFNVIGGLVLGHSSFVKDPIASIFILISLILILAFFEGLQISITTLRLKSLDSKSSKFPIAFNLHKKIKKDNESKKFLAGRQLVVIVVVFFTAQLTSFPNLNTIPFTDFVLPKLFVSLFFKLGIFGAFLVLWTGQLFPQFIANKYPSWFMNLSLNNLTLNISFCIERIGLTKPADWLAKLTDRLPLLNKRNEDLPISNEEKYRQEVEDVKGYGLVSHKKILEIRSTGIELIYQGTYSFYQNDFSAILDDNLIIKGAAKTWRNEDKIIRREKENANTEFSSLSEQEQVIHIEEDTDPIPISDEYKKFETVLRPKIGDFEKGDVLLHRQKISFNFANGEAMDQIFVSRPTKFIVFRIIIYDNPYSIDKLKIRITRKDESVSQQESRISKNISIGIEKNDKGYWFGEFIEFYPQVNSLYEFNWQVRYNT